MVLFSVYINKLEEVSNIARKICAALAAVLCVTTLCGCSPEKKAVNVYLPGDIVNPADRSTTTQESAVYPDVWNPGGTSSSSTSSSSAASAPTEPAEPIDPIENYRGKWYYFVINDKRKRIYERLYYAAANNIEDVTVEDIQVTAQDVYTAFWAFDYENPQFLRLGSGYEITYVENRVSNKIKSVKILYGRDAGETNQAAFEARAETVLDAARELETDYERLKYVHDWLVNNTTYTKGDDPSLREADGAVVNGQAVCEGYAKAFMYFAQKLGYQCICSVGVANLEDHMWNMVKIGNAWYNVDVTWDDPDDTKNIVDGVSNLRHDYFLINDAELRLDHRVVRPVMLPNSPKGFFPYGYDQDASSSYVSPEGVTLTDN